jgi:small multidrug resistance pump
LVDVRKWVLLIAAIAVEVAATLSLRASQDHSAWLVVVVAGYVGSFILLTLVLRTGMPVGVAYGIWGACGTAGDGGARRRDLR